MHTYIFTDYILIHFVDSLYALRFIYKVLHDSNIPWVYGGEYEELKSHTEKIVCAWISVGIRPVFVFDGTLNLINFETRSFYLVIWNTGSTPLEKFATVVSRLNQSHVQPSVLFFRTSSVSRNSRRFLSETRIIPPLAYQACVHALLSFRYGDSPDAGNSDPGEEDSQTNEGEPGETALEVHFADEEGDPYAVELAGRLDGYVTGNDSDFVVLNSDGYRGYIPLDELLWISIESEDTGLANGEDDGFQAVKSKKKNVVDQSVGRGIIPPNSGDFTLSASLYTPASLANLLNIPVSLLPLLGALVGNDYTLQTADQSSSTSQTSSKTFQRLLYERRLTLPQRITHTGSVLRSFLFPPPGKRKQKTPNSVMELIQMTVALMMTTSGAPSTLIGNSEQAEIVEKVVEGTLPYAISAAPNDLSLLTDTVCPLHLPDDCRLVNQMDRMAVDASPNYAVEVASRYLTAYRLGKFSPSLMDIFSTGSFWPELFLENPDMETVSRSISRRVREFGYAVLEDGIILPSPEEVEEEEVDEEDPDEIIDVVESSDESYEEEDYDDDDVSADVGRLRGALRDLQYEQKEDSNADDFSENQSLMEEGDMYTTPSTVSSTARSPVPLPHRTHATVSVKKRKKVVVEYLRRGIRIVAEEVEVPPLSSLLTTETYTVPLQLRKEEDRLEALFSFLNIDPDLLLALPKIDRMAVLTLRLVVQSLHERAQEHPESKAKQHEKWTRDEARAFLACFDNSRSVNAPQEVSERAIQQTAQILTALEAMEQVVQILFLTDAIPSCVHRFSGQRFHGWLTDNSSLPSVDEGLWNAVEDRLETCFVDAKKDKKAKKKEKKAKAASSAPINGKKAGGGSGGLFSMLGDMSL